MAMAFSSRRRPSDINRIFVIIAAGGLGTRMESETNKQFIEIDGVPVIVRTLQAFETFAKSLEKNKIILRAIVVTNKEFVYKVNSLIRYHKFSFVQSVVEGGESRMESVWNGIEALDILPFAPSDDDIVFIHDGARCLIDQETLERCFDGALSNDICAAAVPVKSTIKKTEPILKVPTLTQEQKPQDDIPPILRKSGLFAQQQSVAVETTPKRDELMEVQTPQVFRYGKLVKSYANGIRKGIEATDDTSLAEAMNYKVALVEGSYSNIKITTPEDVIVAESLLKKNTASTES